MAAPLGAKQGATCAVDTGDTASPFANGSQAAKEPDLPVRPAGWQQGRLASLARKVVRPSSPEHKVDVTFVILAAVAYGVFYFSMGNVFLPGHAAWATLLLWVSSQIGALVAWQLRLPRVVGMLGAGMMMRNIPWAAADAFPARWGTQMRAGALATIFLRCGLELDFGTMRRFKYPAMRLALLPGLCEAFFDGGLAVAVFNMPVLLAFTMGFILKAVGPGLVVPAMFQLQKTGMGRDQGIPSTIVIAASFDDVIAITGYSIFSSIAITGQGDVAWHIASGPLQVVFGILGGLLAGLILGCTRMFSTRYYRLVGIYGAALLLMYFLEYYNLLSGGALGALFVGLVASNAWEKGVPKFGSLGPSFVYSPEIERVVAVFWQWVWEPMLFVTIGSSIDFATLDTGIIPRSILIICTGVSLRTLVTYFVMGGFGYTWREKLFYAVAWTPKATVQAALSAAPLALINQYKTEASNFAEWQKWGDEILVTGIFTIVICGTLGTLAIHLTSPHLLMPTEGSDDEEASTHSGGVGGGARLPSTGLGRAPLPRVGAGGRGIGLTPADSDAASQLTGPVHRRAASAAVMGMDQEMAASDQEMLAEWMDAIRVLTAAVSDDRQSKADLIRLSDRVLVAQKRLEAEMGRREPSVRELFRTAAAMAQTFLLRDRAGQDRLGLAGHRRSQDNLAGVAGGGGGAVGTSKGAGSSRPHSPDLEMP